MRLTKRNPETGQYEYIEKAKTQEEFNAQRKAVIQRLGEYEDRAEMCPTCPLYKVPVRNIGGKTIQVPKFEYKEDKGEDDEQR